MQGLFRFARSSNARAEDTNTSERSPRTQRRIEKGDIGSARALTVEQGKQQVADSLSFRVDRLFPDPRCLYFDAQGLKKNAVACFWGSPDPTTPLEREIHRDVSKGLGFHTLDITTEPLRPFYNLSLAECDSGLRVR
ncbi:hypothetical protein KEM54_001973, partial [Ascosphaera aggregata]